MPAVAESLKGRHFTRVADWSGEELLRALVLTITLRNVSQRRIENYADVRSGIW